MRLAIETLVAGFATGAIYAIIAVSISVIYQVSGVFNVAAAYFASGGALLAVWLHNSLRIPVLAAVVLGVLIAAVVGGIEYLVTLSGRRDRTNMRRLQGGVPFIITLGVADLIEGWSQSKFGDNTYSLPVFSKGVIKLGSARVAWQDVWVIGIVLFASLALYLVLTRTLLGKGFRACANDRGAAAMVGIPVGRVIAGAFVVGAGLAALAGMAVSPLTFVSYDSGQTYLIYAFVAVVLGGLARAPGAAVGGVVIGVVGAFAATYVSSAYGEAIVFGVAVAILWARPTGLISDRASTVRI